MFTPDAQVLDFSAQDWLRLPDLFLDQDAPDRQYDEARLNAPHVVETVLSALRHNSAGVEEARA